MGEHFLFGAGGHAKVVLDAAKKSGVSIQKAIVEGSAHASFYNLPIVDEAAFSFSKKTSLHIAIGDNQARKRIASEQNICSYFTVIHPTAIIASDVTIGEGCFIGPGAIINANAKIGRHVIINSGAIVEHDVEIASYAHVCPGSVVAGGSKIGEGVLIGANSSVIPLISIGDWAIIGAGSAVVKDVPKKAIEGGVPSKNLKT